MLKNFIKRITPKPLLSFYHYCLAFLGALIYGFPSKKIIVIGVTGTSGKSTVVELVSKIFETAGFKVASLSSLRFKIGEKEEENKLKMTMPGRFKIQKFLKQAVKAGCKFAILEVTSEGIKQHRHKFINFKTAVLTNLTPEHIESHGGFENYKKAKAKLFKACSKTHIINLDDKNAEYFWQIKAEEKIGYSLKEIFKFIPEKTNLIGEFNLYNALTAVKIALSQGISQSKCEKALKEFKGMPGRLEIIAEKPFKVVVDYAHTPEQLKNVYQALNSQNLICVLGSCGGGRDKWKRPVMGKIAQKYCKKVIITNEDPYNEDPMDIINQVAGNTGAEKILDRKEAIKKAIQAAGSEDTVIITGKGSEPWMCVAEGKKIPWDDRKIVREKLAQLNLPHTAI